MTPARRKAIHRRTLAYLGDLLLAHPDVDNGLYDGLTKNEEAELARAICRHEGRKIRERAKP